MKERINLDSIAATKPAASTLLAMMPFYEEFYGSSTSAHQMGQELLSHIEKSYRQIYALFSANEEDHFVFTTSYEESISQVINSVYRKVAKPTGKNQFISTSFENGASLAILSKLTEDGCVVKIAKAKNSIVSADSIADEISPRTCLVSISFAHPLTGVLQPISDIAKLCRDRGILLHVDVSTALGKINIDLHELGADFVTFSGNSFHAPQGTAGAFFKKEKLAQVNVNTPLLVALGQAALLAKDSINLYCTHVAYLRSLLEAQIQAAYPEAQVLFQDQERVPHITCITFPGILNEALLYALNRKGVFASLGTDVESITFSLSLDTTEQEINMASQIIADAAKKLRRTSKALV